jgi:hypothetical protein
MYAIGVGFLLYAGVSSRVVRRVFLVLNMFPAVLLIYFDSIVFVSGTAVLSNGFGVDSSQSMCSRAVLLCLGCYMTTKVSIHNAESHAISNI